MLCVLSLYTLYKNIHTKACNIDESFLQLSTYCPKQKSNAEIHVRIMFIPMKNCTLK